MPLTKVVACLADHRTGDIVTPSTVLLIDLVSQVFVLCSSHDVPHGMVVQPLQLLDWDPDETIHNLTDEFVKRAFEHDEEAKARPVEALRRRLKDVANTAFPESMSGRPYVVAISGLAFPLNGADPVVVRQGHADSLVSMSLFDIFTPHGSPHFRYLMPDAICVRPAHSWWTTVRQTMKELLQQHFASVDCNFIDFTNMWRVEHGAAARGNDETVVALRSPYPAILRHAGPAGKHDTLRTLS